MIQKNEAITVVLLIFSMNALFGCTDKKTPEKTPAKKQTDEDSPKQSPDSDVPQIDQEQRDAEKAANADKIRRALAKIQMIKLGLENYNSDVGFYPKDPKNRTGADIPDFLFIALNNQATVTAGGGPNYPYTDYPRSGMGLTKENGEIQLLDSASAYQLKIKQPAREADEVKEFDDLKNPKLKGKLLFLDPWNRPFHYREWASKPEQLKLTTQNSPKRKAHNSQSFDIWSNGPDGVNNHGVEGSDDITNWRD